MPREAWAAITLFGFLVPGCFETVIGVFSMPASMALCIASQNVSGGDVAARGGSYCADEPRRRPNFGRSSCSFWTISFPRFSTSQSAMSFRGIETHRKPCRSPRKLAVSLFVSRDVRRARKVSAALAERVMSCQPAGPTKLRPSRLCSANTICGFKIMDYRATKQLLSE
jgi:hypothetical protein